MKHTIQVLWTLSVCCATFFTFGIQPVYSQHKKAIQPWKENPSFWQYKGKPVMLLGASDDDNLFQWPKDRLIPHLDSMVAIGANYARNTMSDRNDKGFEIHAFGKLDNGKYDLETWNPEYWKRFEFFLKETAKRDIIVQIEIWDRFDHFGKYWKKSPYRPGNNVNYSAQQSGLSSDYPQHPAANKQPFFFTTPRQRNNKTLLAYQKRFVAKMLSHTLRYRHVLYCIDNETSGEEQWGAFWAEYVGNASRKRNKKVYITEMWDDWRLTAPRHLRTFDRPDRYSFCDVSQNNQIKGQEHWDNFRWTKKRIANKPRPLNTVKTYGAQNGRHGSEQDGLERWWRHIIGGVASARFHRPSSGLGLSALSATSIKIARKIEQQTKYWNLTPDNTILKNRQNNEAYHTSDTTSTHIIYFPDGGDITLPLKRSANHYTIEWINVKTGKSLKKTETSASSLLDLQTPATGNWIVIVTLPEKKNI
ncbi:hypothetical protein FUAX_10550 [Fulvitalea axinellae]|uniref:DUF6298 domain-containing protein n=1 Tax=Fulvitalea axinellae TaxID=1182444 RepID=A0AAU9CFA6_9BACT|nr:hypothetical protein FUAX_10550 [Fulvitalea axinellae]